MKAFGSAQSQGETAKYNSPFTLDQSKKLSEKSRQFQPLEAAKSTVKDFASSTTIHGITYIFDAAIKILDRLFWILVVACGVFLAVLLSYQAWDDWKSNPVLTSVSSTGLPLRKVDYPAITLCSQGIIQDVVDKALIKQFNDFVQAQGVDISTMTEAEKKALEADFNSELYPGATTSPQSLVNVLVSDNPTESIKSSVLTNPEAACVDVPSTCEPPWFYPNDTVSYVQPYPGYEVPCIAHFGLTKANEDKCEDEGGQTIYFTKDGNEGYFMGYMMSAGELSYVGNSSFWYNNLFIDNVSYSIDGEPMNDLYNFIYGYQYNLSGFDPNKKWCAYAENSYGYAGSYGPWDYFNYTLVDCETSPIEAERICFRFPNSCSNETLTGPTGPTGPAGRKKRQAQEEEGSLDIVFLPSKQVERENIAKQARASYATNFRKMNLQKSYPSLFEILWYTQLPCFDVEGVTSDRNGQYGMLKACYWKGYSVPCSKIFTTFPTDQGMCCTFNMESAERMFQEGKYQDMVMSMQTRDRNLSFDRNSQLPPDWYNDQEPISEAGRSKGLQVLLDAHSNMVSGGTVPEDFDGFYAIIDDKNQFPMTTRKSVLIRPGHNNFVSIGATTIDAAESLIDIEQDKRNCLFPTEMEMSVHKNYSQANCLLECQLDYAVSMMNVSDPCLPWYFPINDKDNARLCDPWEAREFRGIMSGIPFDTCDYCLPDCKGTIYTSSVTAAPFRRCDYKNLGVSFLCNFDANIEPPVWGQNVVDQYLSDIGKLPDYVQNFVTSNRRKFADPKASGNQIFKKANEDGPDYDAYQKDIAMVTFFFETSTVFEYRRDERMTLVGYISQLGGLLGLFMGFSFISAFEIFYWFIIRFTRNL